MLLRSLATIHPGLIDHHEKRAKINLILAISQRVYLYWIVSCNSKSKEGYFSFIRDADDLSEIEVLMFMFVPDICKECDGSRASFRFERYAGGFLRSFISWRGSKSQIRSCLVTLKVRVNQPQVHISPIISKATIWVAFVLSRVCPFM